jgi:hypothetical protein
MMLYQLECYADFNEIIKYGKLERIREEAVMS